MVSHQEFYLQGEVVSLSPEAPPSGQLWLLLQPASQVHVYHLKPSNNNCQETYAIIRCIYDCVKEEWEDFNLLTEPI